VSAKLCIDESGAVTSVTLFGVLPRDVEAELRSALRTWRYRPFRKDGAGPVPACFAVGFRTTSER
jgi:hypothetical protein